MLIYRYFSEEEEIFLKGILLEVNKFFFFRCLNVVWRGKELEMIFKICLLVVCMFLVKVCVLENIIF